jgi:hypothetical protein
VAQPFLLVLSEAEELRCSFLPTMQQLFAGPARIEPPSATTASRNDKYLHCGVSCQLSRKTRNAQKHGTAQLNCI